MIVPFCVCEFADRGCITTSKMKQLSISQVRNACLLVFRNISSDFLCVVNHDGHAGTTPLRAVRARCLRGPAVDSRWSNAVTTTSRNLRKTEKRRQSQSIQIHLIDL